MLTLYGSDLSGPAIKVRLTASALDLDYTWQMLNLREGEQKKEWFLNINPVGKVPAMDDGGFHLFESNAICKYLCSRQQSSLYPQDLQKRAIMDQWIDFISFHIGVHLTTIVYNRVFAPRRGLPINEKAISDAQDFLKQYLPVIEKQLSEHKHVVTQDLSLADIILLSLLEPIEMANIDLGHYPHLIAWRSQLKGQNFYTRCYKEYGEMLKAPVGR